MKRFIVLAAAVLMLLACDEKKPETKADDPSAKNATATSATTAAATPTPAAVSINDSDIATPADFEEAAEKSIDKKNYKTELSTLETDIAKD